MGPSGVVRMSLQREIVTPFSQRPRLHTPGGGAVAALALCLALTLGGCGGGGGGTVNIANSQGPDPGTVDYPIFYVKRTVPTNADGTVVQDDLRMMRVAFPSANLYMRAAASPEAPETNITGSITAGADYDVKDVDVSPDGTKVAFAMRGPLTANMDPAKAPSWRIYEYTIATNTLAPMIDPSADTAPDTVNDVSPHYLPDGSIVWSTTRQRNSQAVLINEGKPEFIADDEARTEPIFDLEVISPDRTTTDQIEFNQSHDRDSTVLANGRILFTRWNDSPGKDQMDLYSINPDGTDLELYYGAQSHMTGTNDSVIEFSHPREMQNGDILVIAREYTDVDFGGQLEIIDGNQYVENTQPLLAYSTLTGPAQTAATTNQVSTLPGPSAGGRFNSAWPLWDGTGRILVSWTECRLLDNGTNPPSIVPCTAQGLAQPNAQAGPPLYSLWMFDPAQNTFTPIISPTEGVMITDVAAAQPRTTPTIIPPITPDPELQAEAVGEVDIKSVYDFDGVDTAPGGIVTLSSGATAASQRPARFVRLVKAVSIPDRTVVDLAQEAFGASDYMREIMGYAPVEPDGSVLIQVPADVAFEINVLDANGRRLPGFPEHSDWLQVRAGEVLKCNGCHTPATTAKPYSHGRDGLFPAAYGGAAGGTPFPDSVATYLPTAGQTMAEARAAVTCLGSDLSTPQCSMMPSIDVFYTDVWTNTALGLTQNPPIAYQYSAMPSPEIAPIPTATPGCESSWASNCRVVINYPEHIEQLWTQTRTDSAGNHTCTQGGCHSPTNAAGAAAQPAGNLDLSNTASNADPDELVSYVDLLFTHTVPGPPAANGDPTTITVGPFLDAGSANGPNSSASLALFAPNSGNSIHAGILSPAELRLISEWLDIGAQNFNNPFDPNVPKN
jgi:Hydrazine synthase alpha subunit middle domain